VLHAIHALLSIRNIELISNPSLFSRTLCHDIPQSRKKSEISATRKSGVDHCQTYIRLQSFSVRAVCDVYEHLLIPFMSSALLDPFSIDGPDDVIRRVWKEKQTEPESERVVEGKVQEQRKTLRNIVRWHPTHGTILEMFSGHNVFALSALRRSQQVFFVR
jgi:hypothetical protein